MYEFDRITRLSLAGVFAFDVEFDVVDREIAERWRKSGHLDGLRRERDVRRRAVLLGIHGVRAEVVAREASRIVARPRNAAEAARE
jgi:hypothetical protein